MNRRKAGLLVIGTALGLAFGVTGTARADVLARPAAGVTRVTFDLPGMLTVRQGNDEQLRIDAESTVLSRLSVVQKGDALTITSNGSFRTDKPIRATLVLKSLRALKSTNSGKVQISNMQSPELAVEAAGSGDIALQDVRSDRVLLDLSGSGKIDASGSGGLLRARITGSGSIDAVDFVARDADVAIEGSGDIRVQATGKLKADISGAGEIGYRGKPAVTQSVSGAGSVGRI